jgi:hypothetical protein
MVVAFLLESRLNAVGQQDCVDVIGNIVGRRLLGQIVCFEIGFVEGDDYQRARRQMRLRTGKTQAGEKILQPARQLIDEDRSSRLRIGFG